MNEACSAGGAVADPDTISSPFAGPDCLGFFTTSPPSAALNSDV
jgi:hypothetical protein